MAEREPAMLGDTPRPSTAELDEAETTIRPRDSIPPPVTPPLEPKPARRGGSAPVVHVAGFWRRFAAGWVDVAIILPVGLILSWVARSLAGVHLPASRIHGPDFWLDLILASDPAIMTTFVMVLIVAVVYLMVFQALRAQTIGMRLLGMRIVDVWGDRPSIGRCAARTGGYLANLATAMLGFLWVGFDSEKRGLHDWIAGTYVIKA